MFCQIDNTDICVLFMALLLTDNGSAAAHSLFPLILFMCVVAVAVAADCRYDCDSRTILLPHSIVQLVYVFR